MLRRLLLATTLTLVLLPASPAGAAPPSNDNFGQARALSGRTGSVIGANGQATAQPGEPNLSGVGNTIWYRWTAPQNGSVTFDTCGSGADTDVHVYRGTALNNLRLVTNNDDREVPRVNCNNNSSEVTFGTRRNVTYRIQIDGFSSSAGSVKLAWGMSRCAGQFATVDLAFMQAATDGPDVIVATGSGGTNILGGGGNDLICGTGSGDAIHGGAGRDTIYGGAGGDALYADGGGGTIFGGPDGDSVEGGPGDDVLKGGAQGDSLIGHGGRDSLDGGTEVDSCDGGPGQDTATAACETTIAIP